MDSAVDYATYIIDITLALMEHRQGLTDEQLGHIDTMYRRAAQFVTDFMYKQDISFEEFASYLHHDALTPVTVVVGYSELLLDETYYVLDPTYREAINEIRECGYILRDIVNDMYESIKHLR